ncbi:MAG: hypothetical protein IKJ39_12020 [Lachnospiraceae bacterium]|nr:hypothetical protein [Lachnospiraceae bacterium]
MEKSGENGLFGHRCAKVDSSMPKEKVLLWAVFWEFVMVCPKDVCIRFCYRVIGELLGIGVDYYELVPNMLING